MGNIDELVKFLKEKDIDCNFFNDSMFKSAYVSFNKKQICKIEYDLKVISGKCLFEDDEKHLAKVRRLVKKFKDNKEGK